MRLFLPSQVLTLLFLCWGNYLWKYNVNAQQNSDSLSFVLTGNTLEDLSTQLEAEANKAFEVLESNPEDLATVVSSLTAQVVSATTQLMLQFINSNDTSKDPAILATQISQTVGDALSTATQSSTGTFSALDVTKIQDEIKVTVETVLATLDKSSSIEQIVEAVGQQVLDIVGQAFAEITGGTFSGTFNLSNSTTPNTGSKALNTTAALDIVQITNDLKDSISTSLSEVDYEADIDTLQAFLSNELFNAMMTPVLQLVYSSIQQGQLSDLSSTISLTVKNALSSLKNELEDSPFDGLDINQVGRDVEQAVEEVVRAKKPGITEVDLTKQVAEKAMNAIINGFNTAVIANTGSLILRAGDIDELSDNLEVVISSILQSISSDTNITDVRNSVVTDLFVGMSQIVTSIVYTLFQDPSSSSAAPQKIASIFQDALASSVQGTLFQDLNIEDVGSAVEQAVVESLNGPIREIAELTTDAASAAMNAAINQLLITLGPSTVSIDSAIDAVELTNQLVAQVQSFIPSLTTNPNQNQKSTFQINILREIATAVSALTYSMLDFENTAAATAMNSTQQINQILNLVRAVMQEIKKAPGGYSDLDVDSVIEKLETQLLQSQISQQPATVNADLVAQQVAQEVVDVVADEVAQVSKVLVTLAVSVSAEINNALQSPQTGKEAIISVLQGGNSVAIADAIVESLGTESEAAVSEALVLVLQENVSLPDQVVAALATSLSIAQTTDPDSADVLIEVFISASEDSGGPDALILPRLVTEAFTNSQTEMKNAFVDILSKLGNRSEDGCGLLTDLLAEVQGLAKTQDDQDAINSVINSSPNLKKCISAPSISFQDILESPQGAAQFVSQNVESIDLIADVFLDAFYNDQQEEIVQVTKELIMSKEIGIQQLTVLIYTLLESSASQMLPIISTVIKQVGVSDGGLDSLVELFSNSFNSNDDNITNTFLDIAVEVVAADLNCSILQPVFQQIISAATSPSQQNALISTISQQPSLLICLQEQSVDASADIDVVASPPAPWFVGVISVEFEESIKDNPQTAASVIIDNIVYPTATALAIVDALDEGVDQNNLVLALSLALDDEKVSASEFGVVMEVMLQAGGPTALTLMSDVFSVADAGVLSLLIQYAFTEAPTVQDAVTQVLLQISSAGSDCSDVNKIISNSLATALDEERQAILNGLQTVPQLAACLQTVDTPAPNYTIKVTMELEQVIGQPEEAKQFIISNIQYPNEVSEALVSALNGGRYLDVSQALVLLLQDDDLQKEQLATLFQVMLSLDLQATLSLLSEAMNSVSTSTQREFEPLAALLHYALVDAPFEIRQAFVQILANLDADQNCDVFQFTYDTLQGQQQLDFVDAIQSNDQFTFCAQALRLQEEGLIQKLQMPQQAKQFIVDNLNDTESIAVSIVDGVEQGNTNQLTVVLQLLLSDTSLPEQNIAQLLHSTLVFGDQETLNFLSLFLDIYATDNPQSQLLIALIQYVYSTSNRDVRDSFSTMITQIPNCGSFKTVVTTAVQNSDSSTKEVILNSFLETEGLSYCIEPVLLEEFDFELENQSLVSKFQAALGDIFLGKNILLENFEDADAVAEAVISTLQAGPEAEQYVLEIVVSILTDESLSVQQMADIFEVMLASSDTRVLSVLVQAFERAAQAEDTSVLVQLLKLMLIEGQGVTSLLVGLLSLDDTCGAMKNVVSSAVRSSSVSEAQQIVDYIRNSEDLYFCIDGALLQQQTQQTLTYYKTKENGTVLVGGCYDLVPSNEAGADCVQQKEWGKCERKWMLSGSFCASTCDFCSTQCIDIQPDLEFTCQQQKDNGQCDAEFIVSNGFCKKTCGRCCSDIAPNSDFTCSQQKEFGKCDEPWMIGGNFCDNTCGRCGAAIAAITQPAQIIPPPQVFPAACVDTPPNPWFTCQQQKEFGMCDRDWMTSLNYCAQTCGRCPTTATTTTTVADECTDFFPGDTTCQQEMEWGKCDRDWMISQKYCQKTCGRCNII